MNTMTKQIIGAAIGGAFGWFVGGVIVEMMRIQQEKKEYPWVDGTENNPIDETTGQPLPDEENKTRNEVSKKMAKTKQVVRDYTNYFDPTAKESLEKLAAKYNQGVVEEDELEGDEVIEDSSDLLTDKDFELLEDEAAHDPIEIITMEEYASGNDEGYKCVTLSYYDDDVVTDDKDTPLRNPESFLGTEALFSFGELSQDENIVYVRNDDKKAMYEVVRMNKDYSTTKVVPLRISRRAAIAEKRAAEKAKEQNGEEDN